MQDHRPRAPRAETSITDAALTRAQLVRYFAWGYLSRRELNAKLNDPGLCKRQAA